MSQSYKFKSTQISESKKEKVKKDLDKITVFETGDTKTIDFFLLDGTRQNFSYTHYLTSWLGKDGDDRFIKIFFATHFVIIKGFCLDVIYNSLLDFKIKTIYAHDERYASTIGEGKTFVTDIEIQWKGEESK